MRWSELNVKDGQNGGSILMTGGLCLEASTVPSIGTTQRQAPRRKQRVQGLTAADLESNAAPVSMSIKKNLWVSC